MRQPYQLHVLRKINHICNKKGGNYMSLTKYINEKYEGNPYWFVDEVKDPWHTKRIMESIDMMEYLDGSHKILKRPDTIWKGRHLKTRKIVLQLAKPILTFASSFILKNPVTLTSDDNNTLEVYKEIYKKGKYDNLDVKVLDNLLKYGEVFEYIYLDDNKKVKSQIIRSIDAYPVIDANGNILSIINYYVYDGISYFTIYTKDKVLEYNDNGGEIRLKGEYNNLSGLPIRYILPSEADEYYPRSDMKDWINIIDEIEVLVSRYSDSFFKFLNPLPIMTGTKLSTGKDGEGAVDPNLAGQILQLDHMSTFEYQTAKMDYQSFKEEYKILEKNLMNISMTPSIAMSGLEIANISTDSIRILFNMAIAKATITSKHLYDGFDQRWKKIKRLLRYIDKDYKGYISCTFKFDIPSNDQLIVDSLVKLHEAGRISKETFLEQSPFIYDVSSELGRLDKETTKVEDIDIDK